MAKETTKAAADDGMVDIFIPRGQDRDDPNYLVSINGVNYVMPKGKTSRVPQHVYDEIMRSREAEAALYERMNAMQEEAAKVK